MASMQSEYPIPLEHLCPDSNAQEPHWVVASGAILRAPEVHAERDDRFNPLSKARAEIAVWKIKKNQIRFYASGEGRA